MAPSKVNISSIFDHLKNYFSETDCPLCLCERSTCEDPQLPNSNDASSRSYQGLQKQSFICSNCYVRLPFLKSSCSVCAMPISSSQQICGQCLQKSPTFDKTIAAFHYEPPISDFILSIKYSAGFDCLPLLTNSLQQSIVESYEADKFPELMIPVPLNRARLVKRGFNQATEVAKFLSRKLTIPLASELAFRSKTTVPQADLSAVERTRNLKNAFSIKGVAPSHCAVIDDVMTTGSTVDSLSKALKKAGATRVDVWCLARAFPVD